MLHSIPVLFAVALLNNVITVQPSNTYYPTLINHEFNCGTAARGLLTSDDYCIINCNDSNINKQHYTVRCGAAGHCLFNCNVDKCFDSGLLYASYSNLLSISSKGTDCMRRATVFAPNIGDVLLSTPYTTSSTDGTFKELTIHDGTHTNSMIINCSGVGNKVCKDITVNAQRTQFLKIIAEDYASIDSATINCPQNSYYNGSEAAPCIIEADGQYVMGEYMQIRTLNGSPQDVIFTGSITGVYTSSVLYCQNGISVINGNTFNGQGDCWIVPMETSTTSASTTTASVTALPTTSLPTTAPTTTLPTTFLPTTAGTVVTTDMTKKPVTNAPTTISTSMYVATNTADIATSTDEIVTTKIDLTTSHIIDIVSSDLPDLSTTDIEGFQVRIQHWNEVDTILFVVIFISMFLLIILLILCIFIVRKSNEPGLKRGESELPSSPLSQELAQVSTPDVKLTTNTIINILEGRHAHINSLSLSSSLDSNETVKRILREGRMSQIVSTSQIPEIEEMKQQITVEELTEIKKKYDKKKSTSASQDDGWNNNNLFHIDRNRRDRKDSEELYVDHDNSVTLVRYETPKSDITYSSESGNPTKVTRIRLPSAHTAPQWM